MSQPTCQELIEYILRTEIITTAHTLVLYVRQHACYNAYTYVGLPQVQFLADAMYIP